MRLDKSAFTRQSLASAANHQDAYAEKSWRERGEIFRYLMQVNFGFLGSEWPKMDKSVVRKRKST